MNLRLGSVLPLLHAIGRHSCHRPRRWRGRAERAPVRWDTPRRRADLSDLLQNIRARRLSCARRADRALMRAARCSIIAGTSSRWSAVGPRRTRITRWDRAAAQALRDAAANVRSRSIAQGLTAVRRPVTNIKRGRRDRQKRGPMRERFAGRLQSDPSACRNRVRIAMPRNATGASLIAVIWTLNRSVRGLDRRSRAAMASVSSVRWVPTSPTIRVTRQNLRR